MVKKSIMIYKSRKLLGTNYYFIDFHKIRMQHVRTSLFFYPKWRKLDKYPSIFKPCLNDFCNDEFYNIIIIITKKFKHVDFLYWKMMWLKPHKTDHISFKSHHISLLPTNGWIRIIRTDPFVIEYLRTYIMFKWIGNINYLFVS